MTNEEFNEYFRKRTKTFAVDAINFCDKLVFSQSTNVIIYQLCKSATSVGANYRAFCREGQKENCIQKFAL